MKHEIEKYTEAIISFHMPGHKNGKLRLIQDPYRIDVTEVEGTDDLHHPQGIIAEAMKRITSIYGSGKSYMLVNGSTGGLLAAISGVVREGDRLLIGRNCHKAVYNAAMINRLPLSYLYPAYDGASMIYGSIEPEEVKKALEEANGKIKAVLVTSPTYEGLVSNIVEISKIVHEYGAVLIVDEAHGAHFAFSNKLPESALLSGADIVIQSTHKTLPCFTQTGLLHVSKEAIHSGRIDLKRIEKYLSVFQSSSPSYIFMTSIDEGTRYMENHKQTFDRLISEIQSMKKTFNEKQLPIRYLDKKLEIARKASIDPLRLTYVIDRQVVNISGWKLADILRHVYHIQVEMASNAYMTAIATIADSGKDIKYLEECIIHILGQHQRSSTEEVLVKEDGFGWEFINRRPEMVTDLFRANQAEGKNLLLEEAEGKVAKEFIIPYPPGIPLVVPGERITREIIRFLMFLTKNRVEIYGIIEGEIQVIIENNNKTKRCI